MLDSASAGTCGLQGVAVLALPAAGTLPQGIRPGAAGDRDSAKMDLGTMIKRKVARDRDSAGRALERIAQQDGRSLATCAGAQKVSRVGTARGALPGLFPSACALNSADNSSANHAGQLGGLNEPCNDRRSPGTLTKELERVTRPLAPLTASSSVGTAGAAGES